MNFLNRASLYLDGKTDAELVEMWTTPRVDRLKVNTFVRYRTLYALGTIDVRGIKERMQATAAALLASPNPAHQTLGDKLAATHSYMMGQREDDGIDVGRPEIRAIARALTQPIVPNLPPVIPDAQTLAAILAPGGAEYTWRDEDGFGDVAAHFAAARVAKARRAAVASARPAVAAALDAWEAAEVAKLAAWEAAGLEGPLAPFVPFELQ